MKHVTHNVKLIILMTILFFVSCFMFYNPTMAQVQLETGLPPISGQPAPGEGLPQYINYLFIFGLGAITILALGQMMSGGIQYILSAGNVSKKEDAKHTIQQALLGLGLLLASYLLLKTINPDLVNLKAPNLTPTQFQGETSENPYLKAGSTCTNNELTLEDIRGGWICQGGKLIQYNPME